jgi:hypothetical protein
MTEQASVRVGHDFVRPFIMTGGRTRAVRRNLRVETMLQATQVDIPDDIASELPSEQLELLQVCEVPLSVAEVAVRLQIVVGVVAIIAGDLIDSGLLDVHHTDPVEIELDMLTKMIQRVRSI